MSVVATLLVLLGTAVQYSSQISRNTQRSRKTALAMEIADGHLEALFTNWRNIYRTTFTTYTTSYAGSGGTDYSLLPTNYFFTEKFNPGPAPVPILYMSPSGIPPTIPLPGPSNFPTEPSYSVAQYRIQAVNPMIELDAAGNAIDIYGNPRNTAFVPPAAYGPNDWQYSYYYLASVDVTVPALTGNVTAKVRRVFEKKFDNPWTYALFYVDDLELQPSSALTITGPIHTNGSLYVGTNNFTAQGPTWPSSPTSGRVEYGSDFVNGYSPKDGQHSGTPTAPNFAKSDATLALSDMPPVQVSPYLPFGWNINLSTASGGGASDDSYHELIERPAGTTDAIAGIRYYTQKPYIVDTQDRNAFPLPYAGTPGNSVRILINEHYWKFANAAARNAAGDYSLADIGKVAYEAESRSPTPSTGTYGTYWKLTGVTGIAPAAIPTWTLLPDRTSYAFANATVRALPAPVGSPAYTSNDTGKYGYQYSDDSYWRLISVSAGVPTWQSVTLPATNPWPSVVEWTFSNVANRLATASNYSGSSVGKIAYQSDDGTFWWFVGYTGNGTSKAPVWAPALQADSINVYTWGIPGGGTTLQATKLASSGSSSGSKNAFSTYDKISSYIASAGVLKDYREGGLVRVTTLDAGQFSNMMYGGVSDIPGFSGVVYFADFGATYQPPTGPAVAGNPVNCQIAGTSTTENNVVRRGVRLKNGATLKQKLTFVSDNPVYVQGDFNTGASPPSNTGTYTSPTAIGYTRWASAVIGDAINILSNNWTDANSVNSRPQRAATNTTVNAALVGGNVPSGSGTSSNSYSGGGENFVRFLEDWSGKSFCYYGSMVQMFKSQQATAVWSGNGNQYSAPSLKWYWDVNLSYDASDDPHWGSPPGNLQIAAYLQQQRWYQVY